MKGVILMRGFLSVALCAIIALCGCASQPSVVGKAPPAPAPVAVGKSNRFEMTQNGRKMSAHDFDVWMKARGIRIAKGPQSTKAQAKPRAKNAVKRR
jgi:hypothetical protein